MGEDAPPGRPVPRAELEHLAGLFDRFEFALDPLSRTAREGESEFEDAVRRLFEEYVAGPHPNLPYATFRCRPRSWCRNYLRKNRL